MINANFDPHGRTESKQWPERSQCTMTNILWGDCEKSYLLKQYLLFHKSVALLAINVIYSDLGYDVRVIKVISKQWKREHVREKGEEREV